MVPTPQELSAKIRLGSQRPYERSIPEPPSVSVFFRPASGLWRSAASRFENQSGANGRRFRRDQDGRMFPSRPNPPSDYPEKLIEEAETRARLSTLQRDELLTQSEILKKETSPPTKEAKHRGCPWPIFTPNPRSSFPRSALPSGTQEQNAVVTSESQNERWPPQCF
jgi:hypothetical protein